MSKNIVVMSDGTGQEGGKGHDTNIYKLFRMLEDRTDRQIVFYDEGLGTDWRKFTGNAFGAGFTQNLLQCYQFIFENYKAGDKIYLFGFSRGAATVRSLSSFIHYFGILPQSRPGLIESAYKLYKKGQDKIGSKFFKQAYKFVMRSGDADERESLLNLKATDFVHEHPNQWAKIEFLGVWDTVPALGLIEVAWLNSILGRFLNYNFHNFKIHPSVRNAYHAISIDDDRLWFHPSLWTEKTRDEQIVEQVWFNGSHTDIGGGFKEAGLSDVTLEWMVEKAVSHGLRIYLGSRKYWNFVVAPDPADRMHPPRKGITKVYKYEKRDKVWTQQGAETSFGKLVIHKSVLDRWAASDHSDIGGGQIPWALEKTNRFPIHQQDDNYQNFLRFKFYEFVKFEWKKYDWKNDRSQTEAFDKWLGNSVYKKYYLSFDWDFQKVYMEDGYKTYCKNCWKDGTEPESRSQWVISNPYHNDKKLDQNWLEGYEPFKNWLKEHTHVYDDMVYFAEPFETLEDFIPPTSLRDYDRDSLEKILKGDDGKAKISVNKIQIKKFSGKTFTILKINMDEKRQFIEDINTSMDNLIKRGSTDKEKVQDRLGYDTERWGIFGNPKTDGTGNSH